MKKLIITLIALASFSTIAAEYSCKATLIKNARPTELKISQIVSPSGNPTFFAQEKNALVAAEMHEQENYVKVTIDFEGKRLETITGFAGTPDSTTHGLMISQSNDRNGIWLECTRTIK